MRLAIFTYVVLVTVAFTTAAPASGQATNPRYVERLTGEPAQRYLHNLRSRRPDVFARAEAELSRRGWEPTDRVIVVRTNREAHARHTASGSFYQRITDTYDSGEEGEIMTWEWEDGDYDTWAGTIYLHEYSTGTWMTVDAQMSLSPDQEWTEMWSSVIDGEDSPRLLTPVAMREGESRPSALVAVADLRRDARRNANIHLVADWGRIIEKWTGWAACTAAGCAGAAFTCNRLNPTPAEKPDVAACTLIGCIASGIACLNELM